MTNQIENIFATFHDGSITAWEGDLKELTLTIDCEYLAEMFDESFELFYVTLKNIELLEFKPWMNEPNSGIIYTELKQIFEAEFEIGHARTEDGAVLVTGNQHNPDFPYSGGELAIKAKEISIKDQNGGLIEPKTLFEMSNTYWNNFDKQ